MALPYFFFRNLFAIQRASTALHQPCIILMELPVPRSLASLGFVSDGAARRGNLRVRVPLTLRVFCYAKRAWLRLALELALGNRRVGELQKSLVSTSYGLQPLPRQICILQKWSC